MTDKKNTKLFFFWAEEWIRRREGQTVTGTVPTLAMRNGDLSQLLDPANPFFKKVVTVNDPGTGKPFPGNIIPASRISHNGQALLNSYPLPTPGFLQGTSNYIVTDPHFSDTRKDTFKIDYLLAPTQRLSFRGTHIPWTFDGPFEGTLGTFQSLWSRPNRIAALSLTSTISPTLINELTLSASSDGLGSIKLNPGCGAPCNRNTYGITYPYIYPGVKQFDSKLPSLAVTGFTSIDNGPYPGSWSGAVFTLANKTTKVLGSHTIKFGVVLERSSEKDFIQSTTASAPATINENGAFRFLGGTVTGAGIGNALLGSFTDYSELGGKPITPWVSISFAGSFKTVGR